VPATVDLSLDAPREQAELEGFLGASFRLERLWHYQEQLDTEFAAAGDEEAFYRNSVGYLYNLTAFAMTGTKLPYLRELVARVPPGARLLDYGCGIGSDGLMLLERGYHVEFADYTNPSTEYLRWRLTRRGLDAPIHDLDVHVPAGFEAAYAFDVIEHVPDPFAFLNELERRARLVEVNFLEPSPEDQDLHHVLPISALLAHAARRRLCCYRLFHGRSHLVLYEPRLATPTARLLNRTRIAIGRRISR
jgi:SAM-dependent methyltransferase